jgi:four helix bundle protein
MKITRFEDLECWQEARNLVKIVYDAIRDNRALSLDLRFSGQFSSAAVSTMSNIAEGFARQIDKEFARGLWISKASAAEVQSLSYAAYDQNYLDSGIVCRILLLTIRLAAVACFRIAAPPPIPHLVGCTPITLWVSGLAILNCTHRHGFWSMSPASARLSPLSRNLGNYLTESRRHEIYNQAEKVSRLTSGLIKYLTSDKKSTSNPTTQ